MGTWFLNNSISSSTQSNLVIQPAILLAIIVAAFLSLRTNHPANAIYFHLIALAMRLLHARTKQLREFTEKETPAYAILSHTWGREEVSFQDVESNRAAGK